MLRTGCQWRNLLPQWPHWKAVYWYASPVLSR
ncbi:transposase [Fibrella rubiginis]|nr:transposase [Fibrella rubiginis]